MFARFFLNFQLCTAGVLSLGLLLGGTTAWAQTPIENEVAKLLASDGTAFDEFGRSVAVDGDTAVIGTLYDDDNGRDAGSAYVFTRDSTGEWSEQAKLLASDGAPGDLFGYSVAMDGDMVVIGAPHDEDNGSLSGSVYVFTRDSTGGWGEQAKLLASDGATYDRFGWSVAVDGYTAVIGAYKDEDNGWYSGSAYAFTRDSTGGWSEQAKLLPSDGAADDRFGYSVAVDGDTAVIGADGDNDNGQSSGSAYVFTRDSTGAWSEQAKLFASDGAVSDQFGWSVAVDGYTAVIGAFGDDDNGPTSGSAYAFTRDSTGEWSEQAKLLAGDGVASDRFGHSVAVNGDTAVIGAYWDNDNGSDSGSAYVFSIYQEHPNQPPVAHAGGRYVKECTGPDGTEVTLDGSGSTDPDLPDDELTYEWTIDGRTASGVNPTVPLPPGLFSVDLKVTDLAGDVAEDATTATVEDTKPPKARAKLVPIKRHGGYRLFRVRFRCRDACDADVTTTAWLKAGNRKIAVENGQKVKFKFAKGAKIDNENGVVEIKAPFLHLVVKCEDASGNKSKDRHTIPRWWR